MAMARGALLAAHLRQKLQSLPRPWTPITLRRLFSNKLFVGGLSFRTDEEAVRKAFAPHGEVLEVKLITDRETGRPKGFGFVTFGSEADAETARSKMTGQLLDGRMIRVDKAAASSRPAMPSFSSSPSSDASFTGTSSSASSSSLPPVSEDWGTIPSISVDIGASAPAAPTVAPTVAPTASLTSEETPKSSFASTTTTTSTAATSSTFGSTSSFSFQKSTSSSNDWGTIPSNIVDFSQGSTPASGLGGSNANLGSTSFGSTVGTSVNASATSVETSNLTSSTSPGGAGTTSGAQSAATVNSTALSNTSVSNISAGIMDASKPLESSASTPSTTTTSSHPLNSPVLTSSGTFDFSNFSFDSTSYRDNDPPLPRRRPRPRPRTMNQSTGINLNSSTASILETQSPFGSNNQYAETSIPKPKGNEYDFGLLNFTPSFDLGIRPQGTFDIDIPSDLPEPPPPEPPKPKPLGLSLFPMKTLPPLDLPWDTPEADNWSDIGKDPPKYDLTSLFPQMGEMIKKDKELHWDPYDFDEEAKATLPPEEEVIEIDSDYD